MALTDNIPTLGSETPPAGLPGGFDFGASETPPAQLAGSGDTDSAIRAASEKYGLDPHMMRGIASIESDMTPGSNRNNKSTQYKGLYQIGNSEWAEHGSGDIYNAGDNAMAAGHMLAGHRDWFKNKYGQDPTDAQIYMMHQQGRGFYSAGAMTNVAGNPYPGMRGRQTHDSFEKGSGDELARRKGQFTDAAQPILGSEVPPTSARGSFDFGGQSPQSPQLGSEESPIESDTRTRMARDLKREPTGVEKHYGAVFGPYLGAKAASGRYDDLPPSAFFSPDVMAANKEFSTHDTVGSLKSAINARYAMASGQGDPQLGSENPIEAAAKKKAPAKAPQFKPSDVGAQPNIGDAAPWSQLKDPNSEFSKAVDNIDYDTRYPPTPPEKQHKQGTHPAIDREEYVPKHPWYAPGGLESPLHGVFRGAGFHHWKSEPNVQSTSRDPGTDAFPRVSSHAYIGTPAQANLSKLPDELTKRGFMPAGSANILTGPPMGRFRNPETGEIIWFRPGRRDGRDSSWIRHEVPLRPQGSLAGRKYAQAAGATATDAVTAGPPGTEIDAGLRPPAASTFHGAPSLQSYPTDADAEYAQKYGFGHGTGGEPYINRETARAVLPGGPRSSGVLDYIPAAIANKTRSVDLTKPENQNLQQELGNVYGRAALAANRIPIAAYGFDPNHVSLDLNKGGHGTIFAGATQTDMPNTPSWVDMRNEGAFSSSTERSGTVLHEAIHRGLQRIREQMQRPENKDLLEKVEQSFPALAKDRSILQSLLGGGGTYTAPYEEDAVEYLVSNQGGNPHAADAPTVEQAQKRFSTPAAQQALEALNYLAQELRARQRERGPR